LKSAGGHPQKGAENGKKEIEPLGELRPAVSEDSGSSNRQHTMQHLIATNSKLNCLGEGYVIHTDAGEGRYEEDEETNSVNVRNG
jgi:hypothetical protein